MSFKVAAAPHGHSQKKTNQVMAWVVFALIPGVIIQSYFFGWGRLVSDFDRRHCRVPI